MNVQRVTLAVDATHRNQRALRGAIRIAAQLQAEMTAMFVTHADLERFAELPVATEVLSVSARTRHTGPTDLAADIEHLLQAVTRELRDFAREANVACSVVSTSIEQLPGITSTDLLLVDRRAGHTPVSRAELGSVAAKLIADCHESILVFERELALDKPVAVLLGPDSGSALEMAMNFARSSGHLVGLIAARERKTFEAARARFTEEVAGHDIRFHADWLQTAHDQLLSSSLHKYAAGLLVVDATETIAQLERMALLLDALRVPVLLTR